MNFSIFAFSCVVAFSSPALLAAISVIDLSNFSVKVTSENTSSPLFTLCGNRTDNARLVCENISGLGYGSDLDARVWSYESFSLSDGYLSTDREKIIFGELDELSSEISFWTPCKASLRQYRYSLEERITAFIVTGMWPQNSDALSLYCVEP